MKRYAIIAHNMTPERRTVCVSKDLTEMVADAINGLPFIDRAEAVIYEGTQIDVFVSPLAEESDLEDMETLIKSYVEDE